MKTWTKQEYYNRLYEAAYDGTFPSYEVLSSGNVQCVYHGEGKQRCAVGILVPDEKYDPEIEGMSIHCIPKDALEKVQGLGIWDLEEVQSKHDQATSKCRNNQPWDAAAFINSLNKLDLFADVQKKEPREEPLTETAK